MKLWRTSQPGQDWRFMERREIAPVEGGDTYLVRYSLVGTPWASVMVHHILRPDAARDRHDHPWSFVSAMLRGGYWEELPPAPDYPGLPPSQWPTRKLVRRPRGSVRYRRAEALHRIDQLLGDTWTLVLTGRRRRTWGFSVTDGLGTHWVDWRTYCGVDA